jgi:hypothetical protein
MLRQNVLADERSRERHDPDGDQEEKVQIQEAPVHAPAMLEEGVVIHPDDADGEEADEIGGVRGPQPKERAGKVGRVGRHAKLEDEEGSSYRKDAVAERLEPARAHAASLNEIDWASAALAGAPLRAAFSVTEVTARSSRFLRAAGKTIVSNRVVGFRP